jgi:ribonuclease BN (tRNA processing enzyme)
MKLLFLGSGSAYTLASDNFQSNMVLVTPAGRRMLIDCGSDLRWSLARQGLTHRDVTDIYISHLHADHVGGLEYLGFQTRFDPACARPRLYLEASLVEPLWTHCLSGGMGIICEGETCLEDFFDVRVVHAHHPFEWEGVQLEAVPTLHVACASAAVHSQALAVEHGGFRTFITTDTRFDPGQLGGQYERADLIFHDCEIGPVHTGIHSHYDDLRSLPARVRAKTWLYDYQAGTLPDATADGFRGFVRAGQTFDLQHGPTARATRAARRAPAQRARRIA